MESSLPTLFQETQSAALHSLDEENISAALHFFQQNEELLESAKLRRVEVDEDFVLVTLHNLAHCHQRLEQVEMSASYLEACLYNLALGRPVDYRRRKYECRARIQLCALLSQLQRHEGALTHARLASKLSQSLLSDMQSLCFDHSNRHKKLLHTHRLKPLPEHLKTLESASYRHSHDLVAKAFPVLRLLQARIRSQPIETATPIPRLELRSALGVQHYDDWVYSVNIGDIMRIQPLTLFELKSSLEPFAELTRDLLLDKVCLLLVSYYCLATELRLLYGRERMLQAHDYHSKALQIAKDLFPVECPLTEHLRSSYQRHFQVLRHSKSPQPRSKHKGSLSPNQRPRPSPPLTDRKPRKSKPATPSPHTKSESKLPRKKHAETSLVSDVSQGIILTSSALYGSRAESPDWGHQSPSIRVNKSTKRRPED